MTLPPLSPPRDYKEQSCSAIPWHTTFIGQPMQHNYWMYAIVDRIMREVPISAVIELGTGAGALSSVFGMWGAVKSIPITTVDNVMRHNPRILQKLGVDYRQQDIFSPEVRSLIEGQSGPIWLFCDGGCKRKELAEYAPLLKPGSIVSAHDLGVEFLHAHAEPLCEAGIIEPFHPEWWMEANVQLALYRRL